MPAGNFLRANTNREQTSGPMTETFYDLLGIPDDAGTPAIERAYRQRIKETHPDLNDDPDASEQTARLVEARDVLTDSDERARYDRLGHDAYVGGEFSSAPDSGAKGAARGAAEAASEADSTSGPTNHRASTEERRRRERRASRDVDFGTDDDPSSTSGANTATSGGSATATNGGTATATNGGTATTGSTATTGTGVGRGETRRTTASAGQPSWSNTSEGWAARAPASPAPGLFDRIYVALADAPGTAIVAFALYPLLVFGTFLPAFPLFVNVIVGVCLLAMIGATQSVPGLGVAIYGAWTILGTLGLIVAGTTPFGPLGLIVLGATWLPLGFSLLTYQALDS